MTELTTLFPPMPEDDQAERGAHYRGWTALRKRIRDERRVARGLWLAVPVVAAVAVLVVVLVDRDSGGRRAVGGAHPGTAQSLLDRAALAAQRSTAPWALGRGDYLYVLSTHRETMRARRSGDYRVIVRYKDESWTARDGSGRDRHTILPPDFPSPADRAAYRRAGSPSYTEMIGPFVPITGNSDHRVAAHPEHAFPRGGHRMSYRQIRALPADPRAIRHRLHIDKGPDLLYEIAELLIGAPLDGDQRAALFRLAASLPGVKQGPESTATVDDGRHSTTVRFDPDEGTVTGIRVRAGSMVFDFEYTSRVVHRPFR